METESDVLSKVIAAEKEIQQMIEDEKRKARERIAVADKEAEAEMEREKERLRERYSKSLEEARVDAEKKAAAIIAKAEAEAAAMRGLDDALLKEAVLRHIRKILPG